MHILCGRTILLGMRVELTGIAPPGDEEHPIALDGVYVTAQQAHTVALFLRAGAEVSIVLPPAVSEAGLSAAEVAEVEETATRISETLGPEAAAQYRSEKLSGVI